MQLLDEPTAHLDLRHRLRVQALVRELAREGRSALVVSHDLALGARGGDRMRSCAAGSCSRWGRRSVLTPTGGAPFEIEAESLAGSDGTPRSILPPGVADVSGRAPTLQAKRAARRGGDGGPRAMPAPCPQARKEVVAEPTIAGVRAREILDSRGNPTVEAEVVLERSDRGRGGALGSLDRRARSPRAARRRPSAIWWQRCPARRREREQRARDGRRRASARTPSIRSRSIRR